LAILHQAAAEKAPYSVAIIDIQMPDLDGLALVRRINADPTLRETQIILLTPFGKPIPSDALATLEIAASCVKPTRQSALFDSIVQVLTRSPNAGESLQPDRLPRPRAPLSLRKERILVADDNVVNQRVALGNLRKLGYNADVVANGIEVLIALETRRYDIILMDCQMPNLDGYETTREIRRREQGDQRSWVIAMTANVMAGDREKCLAAGMNDYVSKRTQVLRTLESHRCLDCLYGNHAIVAILEILVHLRTPVSGPNGITHHRSGKYDPPEKSAQMSLHGPVA
jgi:CheY-like chemotaxis protein